MKAVAVFTAESNSGENNRLRTVVGETTTLLSFNILDHTKQPLSISSRMW